MTDLSQESPLWREWAESRHSVQQMREELDILRAKLDDMTAERNGLRIALNDARSALKLWARWNDMTEAELALALEATAAALTKAGEV
jgi:hypothetical protein